MANGARGRPKKVNNDGGASQMSVSTHSEMGESSRVGELNSTSPVLPQEGNVNLDLSSHGATEKPQTESIEAERGDTKVRRAEISPRNQGMKLEFVAHTLKKGIPTACLTKNEMEKEALKWKCAVILYVIGDTPSITHLVHFLEKQCLFVTKPDIYFHKEGYFVVRFGTIEERDRVLFEGPLTIANRPVIVREWAMDFSFEKEILREIPLWIQLPKLHLNCWSGDSLSRIGSVLGKPLCADDCTTKQSRISYARLLVEVDVTQPLKYTIPVEGEDGIRVDQKVLYEWVPQFFKKCQRIGHICKEEVRKAPTGGLIKHWQRKEEGQEVIKAKEKGKEPLQNQGEGSEIMGNTNWSIPKRATPTSVIQVGRLQIPTGNTYQVIQEEEVNGKGGDLFPLVPT